MRAYSTQLMDYINTVLERVYGFPSHNTVEKYAKYAKVRRRVSLYLGKVRPLTREQYESGCVYVERIFDPMQGQITMDEILNDVLGIGKQISMEDMLAG